MVEQSQQFELKSTFRLKVLMFTSPSWMKNKKITNSWQEMQERHRSPLNGRGYKEENTNDLHCFLGSGFLIFWEYQWFAVYSILGSQLAVDQSCRFFLFLWLSLYCLFLPFLRIPMIVFLSFVFSGLLSFFLFFVLLSFWEQHWFAVFSWRPAPHQNHPDSGLLPTTNKASLLHNHWCADLSIMIVINIISLSLFLVL